MKSGKTIDISKSSLVSLKAELSRKQEEIKKVKGSESYIKLTPLPKETPKTNPGVENRNKQDLELLPEEIDLLKKSREILEVKAKLYDELQKGSLTQEGSSHYLVDFKHKEAPSDSDSAPCLTSDCGTATHGADDAGTCESEQPSDGSELDDSEWVEYTDCLGRVRTCHRSELAEMKEKDKFLARELHQRQGAKEVAEERAPELLSSDMEREAMRRKWEQQERELLHKKDVHYEDVLFDEARAHGVGYFRFSRDEEMRRREQETLRKVREETETRQKEARLLRERREAQRQARLIAARQRQRQRKGLPPLSEQEIAAEIEQTIEKEEPVEEVAIPGPMNLEEELLKKSAHVRPWDIGKGQAADSAMSQEDWMEKQREERKAEFAPFYESASILSDFDPSRPPPDLKRRKLARPPLSIEEEIEARLGSIRDQVMKEKKCQSQN